MKKIFFNHIPKTAGTTFYEYVSRFYKESEIYPKSSLGGYESITSFDEEIPENIKFIANHKNFRDHLDGSWNVITFVRDPKERLFSLYNHWKSWTDEEIENAPTNESIKELKKSFKHKSLIEILKIEDPLIKFHFINGLSKNLIPVNKHYLINDDEDLFREAKKQLDSMTFIGIVERFRESQFLFEYIFNLPHEKDLEILNSRKYNFQFSEEDELLIEKILSVDVKIYNYALNKFEETFKDFILKEINSRAVENPDLKVFFLHIMKVGGTSTIDVLKKNFKESDVVPLGFQLIINNRISNLNNDLKARLEKLRRSILFSEKIKKIESLLPEKSKLEDLDFEIIFDDFKFIADHTTLHTVLPKKWKILTILRNPKDRILSQINDLKTVSQRDISKIPDTSIGKRELMSKIKSMTAEEILSIDNPWIKQIFINTQTKFVAGFFGKIEIFNKKTDEEVLDEALCNLENFLAVGIQEKFFESLCLIHYKLGLPFDNNVPFSNSRKYEPESVSNETMEKIINLDNIVYVKAKEKFYIQYFEMLEDFVNDNFTNNIIKKQECFSMKDDILGAGWHQREGLDVGEIYRWTGPNNTSTIKLPFFTYQIKSGKINVISGMHSEIIWNCKILINNNEVKSVKEDMGNGRFNIKFISSETNNNNFAELKIETPYTISHADIDENNQDYRKKGLAITNINFDLEDFAFHEKPVLLCTSLGTECGIATYTELLSKNNDTTAIANLSDLGFEIPSHIHLQHEFGIAPYDFMEKLVKFCNENNIKLYVTLHTVLPVNISIHSIFLRVFCFITLSEKFNILFKKVEKFSNKHKIVDKIKWLAWKTKDKIKWLRWKIKETLKYIWWKFSFDKIFEVNWEDLLGDKIVNVNEPWRPKYINESWRYFKNQSLVIGNADKIFAHSESAVKTLKSQGAKNVELFIHPVVLFEVSKDLFSHKDNKIHFGFFGFFNKSKSIYEMIQSCKKIENCELHIYSCVQENHDKDYLKKVESEVDNNKWVHFYKEFIPLEDVVYNLSKCDMLIWNSRPIAHYSSSGSIRQYLAAKRPIIARKNNLVEDLKGVIKIVDEITTEVLSDEIQNYKVNDKLVEYLDDHSWKNSKIKYD